MLNRKLLPHVVLPLAMSAVPLFSQSIQKLDPAMDQIAPANAKIEKIASGFNKWTEGPVWTHANTLLFAEIPANNIIQWIPGKGASVFLHPSGYQGSAPFKGVESGSNGMTLDSQGRVTVAGHARRNVYRLETMDPHGQVTVLADMYQGKKFNSPNDLVYKSDGSLYFTDPPYGLVTQSENDPESQLKMSGVYRVAGARDQKPGAAPARDKVTLLIKDLPRPNGIAFSPDQKYLYVNDSGPKKIWMRYRVQPDGSVAEAKVFAETTEEGVGGPDGMKVDTKGNVYSTGPGGIWVFSPEGKHIGTIRMPERCGNLTFGDADSKTLYITASTSVYRVRLNVAGIKP